MSYFVEIYHSQFTGNTMYSPPAHISKLDKTLKATAETRDLKTIHVIRIPWCKEKNGFYFYPIQTPFNYNNPPIHSISGKQPPRKLGRYERARKIKVPDNLKKKQMVLL